MDAFDEQLEFWEDKLHFYSIAALVLSSLLMIFMLFACPCAFGAIDNMKNNTV